MSILSCDLAAKGNEQNRLKIITLSILFNFITDFYIDILKRACMLSIVMFWC